MAIREEMEAEEGVEIVRLVVQGNLHARGVDSPTVKVTSSGNAPVVRHEGDVTEVECADDCLVDVPRHAQLEIHVEGDLIVESMAGGMEILHAGGNVSLAQVGEVRAQKIRGDLRAAHTRGISAEQVYGNAHLSEVDGAVSVNAKGDANLHRASASVSINCKGDAHLSEVSGDRVSVNAKGDVELVRCAGEISANAAGNVSLHELSGQRVRAVAKGDVHVDFSQAVAGTAKIVTSGDLRVQKDETTLRRGKGVYHFRFGQSDGQAPGEAHLSLVSKGDTHLLGLAVAEGDLRGISADMGAWGEEFGAEMGEEMGAIGAELGAWGAEFGREFGREFGAIGRDIARQVQDKVQRKLKNKMKDLGKRTAKVEWGEGKSWSFNFGDVTSPPKPPTPPTAPRAWDAPFDPVEEVASGEPVTEEERALVLRMLEEGKISATEAARLLEALGDGG